MEYPIGEEIIQIQKVTLSDVDEIAGLYEAYLNAGEHVRDYVEESMRSSEYTGYKAVNENGKIVGFISGRDGIDFTYPHEELRKEIDRQLRKVRIYTTDAFVITNEYQHTRIALRLGQAYFSDLKARHIWYCLDELWIHPNGFIPAGDVSKQWGEVVFSRQIPHFYQDLAQHHMTCPICGKNCICGALVEIRDIRKGTICDEQ